MLTCIPSQNNYADTVDAIEGHPEMLPSRGNYTITKAPDGGTEVLLGPPFKFDKKNIADWKTVRSIAWTGLGIGAGSAVSGILLMRTNANPPRQLRNLIVVPTTDHRSLLLKWYGTF